MGAAAAPLTPGVRTERPQVPFLIVGTPRTGSSAFAEQLALHPHIACGWEPLAGTLPWVRRKRLDRILDGDFARLDRRERAYLLQTPAEDRLALGFRLLFRSSARWRGHPRTGPAVWLERLSGLLAHIRARPELRIIQIVRRDNLAWLTSTALSRRSRAYAGPPYPPNLRATMRLAVARRRVIAKHYLAGRLAALEATNAHHLIDYESFLADPQRSVAAAVAFLGCDPTLERQAVPTLAVQSGAGNRLTNAGEIDAMLRDCGLRFDTTLDDASTRR